MLVITRNYGQSIHIGDDIRIFFLGLRGRQARIGIEAPECVNVVREEIAGRKENSVPSSRVAIKELCQTLSRAIAAVEDGDKDAIPALERVLEHYVQRYHSNGAPHGA